jgi:MFS transporter, DHA2 family, multidrug resistance protein
VNASTVEYGSRRTLIVFGVMLASLLGRVDSTIVNVALPTIQGNLGASYDEVTWVIIGYLMANVVVIPLTPWLALRFGRRQAFVTAIAGFTLMSFLCATATSIQMLVLYRVLQGLCAGGVDAAANTVLSATFPPQKIGTAQSLFTLSAACAPSIGLLLGGILTDDLSWQWCFLINVPIGLLSVIILATMLRNPEGAVPESQKSIDAVGVATLAVGPSLLVYFLSEGDRYDWFSDNGIVFSCIFGTLVTAAFILWELYGTRRPIVDLRIFKFRRVAVGAAVFTAQAFVYLASMVFLPQFTQEILGYTPTESGLLILGRAFPTALCVPLAGWLAGSGKVNVRVLIAGGFALMAIGTYWQTITMTPMSNNAVFFLPLLVAGIGNAFTFSPLFVAIIGGVPPSERPKAAAIISVTIQLAGAIASCVLITDLHVRTALHQSILAANATIARLPVATFVQQHGTAALAAIVESQATAYAFADVSFIITCVAVGGIALSLMLGPDVIHHAVPSREPAPDAARTRAAEATVAVFE